MILSSCLNKITLYHSIISSTLLPIIIQIKLLSSKIIKIIIISKSDNRYVNHSLFNIMEETLIFILIIMTALVVIIVVYSMEIAVRFKHVIIVIAVIVYAILILAVMVVLDFIADVCSFCLHVRLINVSNKIIVNAVIFFHAALAVNFVLKLVMAPALVLYHAAMVVNVDKFVKYYLVLMVVIVNIFSDAFHAVMMQFATFVGF